ncbi:MAG: nitrogenase component 1 [Methanoregula sp.]|jgi:nitrogenase molybdenum-iron protein alpha chain
MAEMDGTLEDMLLPYPDLVKKNLKKHLIVKDETAACCPQIEANTRTIPGIISQRGCAYAGCKGVVVGPIKDMITITHGPVGCGYYRWGTRRNKARADDTTPKDKIYTQLCFITDMQEPDIVFGGEKKLAKMIEEVVAAFHPRAINICATCPPARWVLSEMISMRWRKPPKNVTESRYSPTTAKATRGSASQPATISRITT